MSELSLQSRIKLNNGVMMPVLGLGIYLSPPGRTTERAVISALKNGYSLVDTAELYANERDVGKAILETGVDREDVFITTKLWNDYHGYDSTLKAFERSLLELGTDYIDLFLIHWPMPRLRRESWKAMIKLLREGKARAIGVSNYTARHLNELLDSSEVIPAVNQIEFHPFLYQKELLKFCQDNSIQVEAYSPLAKGQILDNEAIVSIARKYGKTSAQMIIRWNLQHGLVVIPKSVHESRIIENSQVFDFTLLPEDMRALNSLNQNLHLDWDPTDEP